MTEDEVNTLVALVFFVPWFGPPLPPKKKIIC